MRRILLGMAIPLLTLGLVLAMSTMSPAAAATGPEICGGSEYQLKYAASFTGGRISVSKHRNSTTWCAVTFNKTGVRKTTMIQLTRVPYKSGVTWGRKTQTGNFSSYAGPIYLAH